MTGRITHGHSRERQRTREYEAWQGMRQRCTVPTNHKFPRYGGRGIRVCERWMRSFEAFFADMGHCPEGMTIGREDNDGHYEPGNCRWETDIEQANNKSTNRIVEFAGEALTVAQWARRLGFTYSALSSRIRRGWPLQFALDPAIKRRPVAARPQPDWKLAAMTCQRCGAPFKAITSRSRCCSAACRKALTKREAHSRNRDAINARRREARGKRKVPKDAALQVWGR